MNLFEITQFGDVIPLHINLDVQKLIDQISLFDFAQYNTLKNTGIPRTGLSITNNTKYPGVDLESLLEYNKQNNTNLKDNDFCNLTDVYFKCEEIQNIVSPFVDAIARSHILKLGKGGYFPPHRDPILPDMGHNCFRVLVPIYGCNPPETYFFVDENLYHWEHGRAYFINTNKMHHFFSYDESMMIVLNIKLNNKSIDTLIRNIYKI